MTTTCAVSGCRRERRPTRDGIVHALCASHEREALRAFGDEDRGPVSWHARSRAHELPTSIVGGTAA